ncbi:hypothetical protein [Halorientalis halophila]
MPQYHFVCHDCEAEAMVGDRETADSRRREHVAATDHRASVAGFAG